MVTAPDSFEEIFSISARGYKNNIKIFLRDLLKHAGDCSALEFFPGGTISVSLLQRNFLHS